MPWSRAKLTTITHATTDGKIHCTNYVAAMQGQHFVYDTVDGFNEFRRGEKKGLRKWLIGDPIDSCPECKEE